MFYKILQYGLEKGAKKSLNTHSVSIFAQHDRLGNVGEEEVPIGHDQPGLRRRSHQHGHGGQQRQRVEQDHLFVLFRTGAPISD